MPQLRSHIGILDYKIAVVRSPGFSGDRESKIPLMEMTNADTNLNVTDIHKRHT